MYTELFIKSGLAFNSKKNSSLKRKKDMHIIKKPTRGIIKLKSNNSPFCLTDGKKRIKV